jgi:hypothetical protein
LTSFGRPGAGPVRRPTPDDAPAAQVRPRPRQVPARPPGQASPRPATAAPSRRLLCPIKGLRGFSAAPCAFSPARWSQGWSLIARSIAPAGQARSTWRYWGATAATFKAAAPALRDNPCSIAKATVQRQVLARTRSPATSSRRGIRPTMPGRARTARQGNSEYIPLFGS